MKSKLLILSLVILFAYAGPIFAEDMKHEESASTIKAVEVGNKTCPVSGEKVGGDMGEPFKYEYNGKIYKLCCKACAKDFKKDPEKYSKIAEEEVAQEKAMDTEHKKNQGDEGSHDHSSDKH